MRFAALATALLLASGCDSGSANGTVSGTITLDGQPVDGGLIRFIPIDGQSQPDDSPIANGAYSVTMPPGEKRVEISWMKTFGGAVDTATQGSSRAVQMIPA